MKRLIIFLTLILAGCSTEVDPLRREALILEEAAGGHADILGAEQGEKINLYVRPVKTFDYESEAWQDYLIAVSAFYLKTANGQTEGVYVIVGKAASGVYFIVDAFGVNLECLKIEEFRECLFDLESILDIQPLVLWPGIENANQ